MMNHNHTLGHGCVTVKLSLLPVKCFIQMSVDGFDLLWFTLMIKTGADV